MRSIWSSVSAGPVSSGAGCPPKSASKFGRASTPVRVCALTSRRRDTQCKKTKKCGQKLSWFPRGGRKCGARRCVCTQTHDASDMRGERTRFGEWNRRPGNLAEAVLQRRAGFPYPRPAEGPARQERELARNRPHDRRRWRTQEATEHLPGCTLTAVAAVHHRRGSAIPHRHPLAAGAMRHGRQAGECRRGGPKDHHRQQEERSFSAHVHSLCHPSLPF